MKGTELFKKTIKAYLEDRAKADDLFARSFSKTNKNIDDCITYILNTVKNSGNNGFADDEIYSMAVHYYDEENIELGKPLSGNVVVNHHIELSDDEKELIRKKALKQFEDEQLSAMRKEKEKEEEKARKQKEQLKKREDKKRLMREEKLKKMEQTLF